MFKALFNFILFSSIYIAICAVCMTWQTNVLLALNYDATDYYKFVFFATLCSYNFHWYLTPVSLDASHRIQWGAGKRRLQMAFTILGGLASAYYVIPLLQHWFWIAIAMVMTFLYSAPKIPHPLARHLQKVAFGKTLFLTFVWTYVTTTLPGLIAGNWEWLPFLALNIHRFFLIYAICILFDWRDKVPDKAAGIRSLITYMDDRHLFMLYFACLAVSGIAAISLLPHTPTWIVATLLVPVIIIATIRKFAQKNTNDYVYYFVLDGMMAFSAFLHILTLILLHPGVRLEYLHL
ncbi:hypothetical protein COR50_12950 [Chitinophaga caeni]|uniref:UbiA prenyltransferase family protein n=1 Tax=Chitinophaga caeni TaxID=2029983 RepID=A0A291QVE4_9BACT|nr:UbiA family prenyltransferase [Chitinophaga caeni]ATL47999.1 hypothetical protein COR50_12950 [Chitinophaga caeni]